MANLENIWEMLIWVLEFYDGKMYADLCMGMSFILNDLL